MWLSYISLLGLFWRIEGGGEDYLHKDLLKVVAYVTVSSSSSSNDTGLLYQNPSRSYGGGKSK